MGPFDWLGGRGSVDMGAALRGAEWRPEPFSAGHPREALARVGSSLAVKEVELAFFAGEPVYLAHEAPQRSVIISAQGSLREQFDEKRILDVLADAAQPHTLAEVRIVQEYEAYYIDREYNLPLPALFVRLDDSESSMYYVDLRTARVAQSYGTGGRWNRWLYHGLHSFDLPWPLPLPARVGPRRSDPHARRHGPLRYVRHHCLEAVAAQGGDAVRTLRVCGGLAG